MSKKFQNFSLGEVLGGIAMRKITIEYFISTFGTTLYSLNHPSVLVVRRFCRATAELYRATDAVGVFGQVYSCYGFKSVI